MDKIRSGNRAIWTWMRSRQGVTMLLPLLLFLVAFQFVRKIGPLGYPWDPEGLVVIAVMCALALAGMNLLIKEKEDYWPVAAQIVALGYGLMVLWMYRNAQYGQGGLSGDTWFSNAMIMHYKADASNHDFIYQNLHGFYPALYHWVMARIAVITGTPAHKMMPLSAIWLAYLMPVVVFHIWRKLVDARFGFLAAVMMIYAMRTLLAPKPYEVVVLALILPWFLVFLHRMSSEHGFLSKKVVIGGVLGGLLAMTYYYWFFLFALLFLGEFAWKSRKQGLGSTWKLFLPRFYVLFWLLITASPFWAPLLYDLATHTTASFQNRWFNHWMINSSIFQYRGIVEYMGLAYLFIGMARGWLPRFLLLLLGGLLLWNAIGMFTMLLDFPLLHARMNIFYDVAVMLGLALGVIHLAELAHQQLKTPERWLLTGFAISFVFYMAFGMSVGRKDENYKRALNARPPDEILDPELGQFAKGKVFLTNLNEINAHIPVYYFVGVNAHYAHPASDFEARVAFVEAISKSQNPDFIAWMLSYNKWDKVDGVLWGNDPLIFGLDNFPNKDPHRRTKVHFKQPQLQGTYFVPSQSGRWQKVVAPPREIEAEFSAKEKAMVAKFTAQP